MKLSDCKTNDQVEAFKKAVEPCAVEKGRLWFLEWDKLAIRQEENKFVAWQGQHRYSDIWDEYELFDDLWFDFKLTFGLAKVHYWRLQLIRGWNCWVFKDPNHDGPDFFNELIHGEYEINVKKDRSDTFGGFYLDAKIKRLGDIPVVKKRMVEEAAELIEKLHKDWNRDLKCLKSLETSLGTKELC